MVLRITEPESKLFVLVPRLWHFATAPIKWNFTLIVIRRKGCCQSVLNTLPFFAMLCISSVQNNPDFPPGILQTRGFPGVTGTRIQFDMRGWTLLPLINALLYLIRWKWQQRPANESQRVPRSLVREASAFPTAQREGDRTGLAEPWSVTLSSADCLARWAALAHSAATAKAW